MAPTTGASAVPISSRRIRTLQANQASPTGANSLPLGSRRVRTNRSNPAPPVYQHRLAKGGFNFSLPALFTLTYILSTISSLVHLYETYPNLSINLILYLILINIFTYILYYYDKSQSRIGGWRIHEKHLHLLELAGGWSAASYAQAAFQHKTRKVSYRVVFWAIGLVHQLLWIDVLSNGTLHCWFWGVIRREPHEEHSNTGRKALYSAD